MAMTAAERQKRYRERNGRNAGKRRINLVVSASVVARLDELAQQYGVHKQVMLERVILEYGSLLRNAPEVVLDAVEGEVARLLGLAGGDAARALTLLNKEAKQTWPDFSWSKAAAKQASPEYRRVRAIRQQLRKVQQRALETSKLLVKNESQTELRVDQLTFGF
jgi:hypothetical protein